MLDRALILPQAVYILQVCQEGAVIIEPPTLHQVSVFRDEGILHNRSSHRTWEKLNFT